MKKNKILIAIQLLTISLLLTSCEGQSSKGKLDEAKAAIAKSNDIYFQAFTKGDSSIFIDRYAKDCCIMLPNAPAMCGENAALEFFKMAYHKFGLRNGKFITTA